MNGFPPIGQDILRFEELDSTNAFLLREKQHLQKHGLVVITKSQVGGKGRGGSTYVAIPGKNITFSVVIHPFADVEEISLYSLLAGIAVVRGLKAHTTTVPRLKWPNDVLIGHRKLCGILLEAVPLPELEKPALVMGIGINCHGSSSEFPENLKNTIITLQEESAQEIDQESVFQEVLGHIEKVLQELKTQGPAALLKEWQSYSNSIGATVAYETQHGWAKGTIEGLTAVGYLLIRNESGELQVHISGDVIYCQSPYHPETS